MMEENYLSDPAVFLIQVVFGLYIILVLLRLLLQLVRADFYNPLSQVIVKLTAPVLIPLRRVVPPMAGLDTASLLLAWLLKTVELSLVFLITKGSLLFVFPLLLALPALLDTLINIYIFAIFMQAVLSWINPGNPHPAISLLHSLTRPVLRPLQNKLPSASGLDFSPLLILVLLILLKKLLIPPLQLLAAQVGL